MSDDLRDPKILAAWFNDVQTCLETAYLAAGEPWSQSGFSGPSERWERLRRPIADAIDRSGDFLDIGCANGYLLECVSRWTADRGLQVRLHGLDLSGSLADLARPRLAALGLEAEISIGNAFEWTPPRRYDFVRTELCYVPAPLQDAYIRRLMSEFLTFDGKLLVAEYRSRARSDHKAPWVNVWLKDHGFEIEKTFSGFDSEMGLELTRVAVVARRDTYNEDA